MMDKIPDLFGKNYVIAYFAPACWAQGAGLLCAFFLGWTPSWKNNGGPFESSVVFLVVSAVIALLLSATNRTLIRIFEGYGAFNPLHLFIFVQRWRFRYEKKKLALLEAEINRNADDEEQLVRYSMKVEQFAKCFPDDEKWLLPTSLGNAIRAFEVYSRVMYGIESIAAWPRLGFILSKEQALAIEDEKTQFSFWLNSAVLLSLLIIVLSASSLLTAYHYMEADVISSIVLTTSTKKLSAAILFLFVMACFCFLRSKDAAILWGESIKAAFDVNIKKLGDRLGIPKGTRKYRAAHFAAFSAAVISRDPAHFSWP